jgi:hypothetical protein
MTNTIFQITTSNSIGNTLSSINQNYENLDVILTNIQTSAINYWIPMALLYEAKKEEWKTAAREIKVSYPTWSETTTIFEENSSKWLTPIIAWYPCIFEYNLIEQNPAESQERILNWINLNYPMFSNSGKPNYIENQQLIVYSLNYSQDIPTKETLELMDGTECTTSDQKICAHCSKCYHGGGVNCNNGAFRCGGCTNCSKCENIDCYFDNGLTNKTSQIAASITIEYQNKYEKPEMNAFIFKVNSCEWTFVEILATP